ncbi:MAG TPA: thioredoxin family protein, partial [Gemmatimonadaceae bacterium]|nr:thioredoxin family protein [Gemmatimonadaceae bacterium]
GYTISHGAVVASGGTITIPIEADEEGPAPSTISGVAVVGEQAFELSAALTAGAGQQAVQATASFTSAASAAWLDQPFTISNQDRPLSLGLVLLFALAGGLLLNVMPCVLPVISIKVLGFVQQANESRSRVRLLGFAFCAGVIASFWVLAAAVWALRAAGEQIGWGFQFQSPGFLVFMTIVLMVFAMNLFGAFEISGPAIAGGPTSGGALSGAFWHGALATLLATPCSAPFLGTALGFAFAQSTPAMFATLTAVGVGLALPYLLLSLNSGWLRFVPRPGAWMIRFRQAMGFLLIATAVWLLSVLGAQRGPSAIVATLALMTAVAFAIWLSAGEGPRLRRHRLVGAAVGILVTSLALVWTARQLADNVSVTVAAAPVSRDGQPWTRFTPAELQRRVGSGETVFLDFTAEWCWNCKVNERAVLDTPSMRAEFQRRGVTPMKADWTMRDPDITRLLAKFGRAGVPFYVVFPAGKLPEPIVLSEVITSASVIAALERAGGSGAADRNSGS